MEHTHTDVALVGAGPIGLELAVALKRAGIDYVHFDARQIGYTISWFPPQTQFFSSNERIAIAGVPLMTPNQGKATREQYLTYLRGVVEMVEDESDIVLEQRRGAVLDSWTVALDRLASARTEEGARLAAVLCSQLVEMRGLVEAAAQSR